MTDSDFKFSESFYRALDYIARMEEEEIEIDLFFDENERVFEYLMRF